jgi:hypothetical protein
MEQRDKLGLSPRGKGNTRHYGEATSAMDKVQVCALSALVMYQVKTSMPTISIF